MRLATRVHIWKQSGKRCSYCQCSIKYGDWSFDHTLPKKFRGTKEVPKVISCKDCNNLKGELHPILWQALLDKPYWKSLSHKEKRQAVRNAEIAERFFLTLLGELL